MEEILTLYQIQLEKADGRIFFYIGTTKDLKKRIEEHLGNGSRGAEWIRNNFSPEEKEKAIATDLGTRGINTAKWEETKKTLDLMIKYGVNNVRGAEYCYSEDYDDKNIGHILRAAIHHLNLEQDDHETIRNGLNQNNSINNDN